jgi:hypothetical protein
MIDSYREEVILLRQQVDLLMERFGEADDLPVRPVNWAWLDADSAAEDWSRLTGWVDWFTARYELAETLPACWYLHPPILEELSALHVAWCGAYCDPGARSNYGVAFHDMAERVLGRIRDADRAGCANAGAHRDDFPMPTTLSGLAARTEAIRTDIATRPRPTHTHGEARPSVSNED